MDNSRFVAEVGVWKGDFAKQVPDCPNIRQYILNPGKIR